MRFPSKCPLPVSLQSLHPLYKKISRRLKGENAERRDSVLRKYKAEILTDVHRVDIDELCIRLGCNKITGLESGQARRRLKTDGPNELTAYEQKSEYWKLMKALFHGSTFLLWIGAVLCFLSALVVYTTYKFYDYDDILLGTMLITIILLTSLFGYFQERRGNRIMESFKTLIPLQSLVIRDGKKISLPSRDLVVGDLVELKAGDRIPADIRILEARNFKVDNSPITGESQAIYLTTHCSSDNYADTKNMAFFSTCAVEGSARGIIVFCSDNTLMGRVASLTERIQPNRTPMAAELDLFMKYTAMWATFLGGAVGAIAYSIGYTWLEALLFIIGIVVANVPEGLVATVTVSLAITAKKLAKRKCLIKNLEVVETLGATSIICSDKTGTLTQNKMTVVHLWFNNSLQNAEPFIQKNYKFSLGFNELLRCAILCSTAEFAPNQDDIAVEQRIVYGDASEAAILKFVTKCDIDCIKYQKGCPKLVEKPFNSTIKYQLSIHVLDSGRCLLVMKGAPEQILDRCSTILLENETVPLTDAMKESTEGGFMQLANNGERVIGLCDLELDKQYTRGYPFKVFPSVNFPDTGLRFLGFISMIDPPRPFVVDCVTRCKMAGIRVIMITGDHPVTAKVIAKQVGIITDEIDTNESTPLLQDSISAVISGAKMRDLSKPELCNILMSYRELVFARVNPTQKLEVVEALQGLGHIVTGDGVNDSPALKKADIGIAMGLGGSQVSHQSADIILLDDNFSSIVMGIEEGRRTFDNMKKAIAYILTSNVAQITPYMAFVLINIPLPLGITAVLCIDVLTDMLPAISLAYEQAESNIMRLPPRNLKKDILVTCKMYFYAYGHMGLIESAAGFFVYFMAMAEFGFFPGLLIGIRRDWEDSRINNLKDSYGQEWTYHQRKAAEYTCSSAYMITVVVMQVANVMSCRTRYNSSFQGFHNRFLLVSLIIEVIIALLLIYGPGMKKLKLYPVRWYWWCYSIPFAIFMFSFDEWRKWNLRKPTHNAYFEATYY